MNIEERSILENAAFRFEHTSRDEDIPSGCGAPFWNVATTRSGETIAARPTTIVERIFWEEVEGVAYRLHRGGRWTGPEVESTWHYFAEFLARTEAVAITGVKGARAAHKSGTS